MYEKLLNVQECSVAVFVCKNVVRKKRADSKPKKCPKCGSMDSFEKQG